MRPFFNQAKSSDPNCWYHIEDSCFAKVCPDFVTIGLTKNLDFSASVGSKETLIIDSAEVTSFGRYKNSNLDMLKIPFFSKDVGD